MTMTRSRTLAAPRSLSRRFGTHRRGPCVRWRFLAGMVAVLCSCLFATAACAVERIALVIGNAGYAPPYDLRNSGFDAQDIRKLLQEVLGFRVVFVLDADLVAMRNALAEFDSLLRANRGAVALFYYAGHGVNVDGVNYLLPVGQPVRNRSQAKALGVKDREVLQIMADARAGMKIVVLDACRNAPFPAEDRNAVGRGLQVPRDVPPGSTLIAFATSEGQVADDGTGSARNGLYTGQLLRQLRKPGLTVGQVFSRTSAAVANLSGQGQLPEVRLFDTSSDQNMLLNDYVLLPGRVVVDPEEKAYWERAQSIGTAAALRAYLERYPEGRYRVFAQELISKLEAVSMSVAPTADPYPPGKVFKDKCAECPELVVIPGGTYEMGSPAGEAGRRENEGPVHRVSVRTFALGKHKVTRGEYRKYVKETGRQVGACIGYDETADKGSWENPRYEQSDAHPVVCVSWADAQGYVKWLSGKSRQEYRLASEAEWEYAARGGTQGSRYWGDGETEACRYENVADRALKRKYTSWSPTFDCDDAYAETAPVGTYQGNGYGLKDMLGNVSEWLEDCWNDSYQGAPEDGSAWARGDCSRRVGRGSSWNLRPQDTRSARRDRIGTDDRLNNLGFRVARTLP